MARLTPLSKGLIAVAIVGAMVSGVWHFGLKQKMTASPDVPVVSTTTSDTVPAVPEVVAAQPTEAPVVAPSVAPPVPAATGNHAELGRKLLASGDYAQARSHLEQAVQAGDGSAACLLGEMTLKGQGGIPASQDKAASLFQLAQSRGSICFAS